MLLIAGCLSMLLGIAHSILGEVLIFKKLRNNEIILTNGGDLLAARQVRILWASWHLVTIFGWALAGILFWLSFAENDNVELISGVVDLVSIAMFCGALLVLVGTKGKHPGWFVLTIIAVLSWLA